MDRRQTWFNTNESASEQYLTANITPLSHPPCPSGKAAEVPGAIGAEAAGNYPLQILGGEEASPAQGKGLWAALQAICLQGN